MSHCIKGYLTWLDLTWSAYQPVFTIYALLVTVGYRNSFQPFNAHCCRILCQRKTLYMYSGIKPWLSFWWQNCTWRWRYERVTFRRRCSRFDPLKTTQSNTNTRQNKWDEHLKPVISHCKDARDRHRERERERRKQCRLIGKQHKNTTSQDRLTSIQINL